MNLPTASLGDLWGHTLGKWLSVEGANARLDFANPYALLLLLLIPLAAWLLGADGGSGALRFPAVSSLAGLGTPVRASSGRFRLLQTLAALALLVLTLARPRISTDHEVTRSSGLDIMLTIDVSRSMLAEDFTIAGEKANRLQAVKQVTEEFIDSRPNDRIGIMAFAGRPYMVSPLTLNHPWLKSNLERLQIGLVEDGTAIGSAIAASVRRLGQSKNAKSRILVLLTDGDNNAGQVSPNSAAEAAAALGIRLYTIGAGSKGFAPIPVKDMFGRVTYQQIPVSVDEGALRKLAEIGSGEFFRATDEKTLQSIFRQIDQMEKVEVESDRFHKFHELFQWTLGAALLLIVAQSVLQQGLRRSLP